MTAPQQLLFGNTTAHQGANHPTSTTLKLTSAHQCLLRNEPASTWGQIEIIAPELTAQERDQADIAIVLDCSGSMGQGPGSKLDHAIQAARFVLERLQGNDRAALIIYGSEAAVLHGLSADHQTALKHLDQIHSQGMTALAAGLYTGIEQLGAPETGRMRRVFLLSDGQANIGETNSERIAEQVAQAATAGIIVSTFGLGDDYNEDLMEAIAQAGQGGYYFLANPDEAPKAFNSELDDLFQMAIHGLRLSVTAPDGVNINQQLGFDNDGTTIRIGDLAAGATRTVLCELELAPTLGKSVMVLEVAASFTDADGQLVSERAELHVDLVTDEQLVVTGVNTEVLARVAELQAAQAQTAAVHLADAGQFAEAQQLISSSQGQLQSFLAANSWVANADALQAKAAQLSSNYAQLASTQTYDRRSRKDMHYSSYMTRNSQKRDDQQ